MVWVLVALLAIPPGAWRGRGGTAWAGRRREKRKVPRRWRKELW